MNEKKINLKKEINLKEKINIKDTVFFKKCVTNFKIISTVFICLDILLLLIQLIFKRSNLIIVCIISIIPIMYLLLFKDIVDVKKKNSLKVLFYVYIVFFLLLVLNDIIINMIISIFTRKLISLANILYILDFILVIVSFGLSYQEGIMETIENIFERDYLKNINSESDKETPKPGDAILGYKVDEEGNVTDEPVILPMKDRFLHMLILGPTGCGKTSQSLIPMINRDMQDKDLGIIVLEPKGDLAEKVFAMAEYYGREVIYFNPILPDCAYFNPLYGKEIDVVENMATTFNMLNPDSPQFFKDMSENLIRKSTKLLKRLYKDDATLLDLNTLVWDTGGKGRKMVMEFSKLSDPHPDIQKENEEIYQWFLDDYYTGAKGEKGATKTYEHCSGVRTQISKLVSNEFLRKVLNPPKGHGSDLDFDDALERGIIVSISTAQGALRALGRYLGYFIILQLQASVFRRPGTEFTRKANMLFIDEFQVYANPGFADMLTMGRSYRVASHLATQARDQIGMGGGNDGKAFIQLVSTNARNKIIYPGVSSADAKYYSEEFGEKDVTVIGKTYAKKRFFSTIDEERVSTSVKEDKDVRFSITDIIYRPFGMITYCIVKNNTVQPAGVSKIEYIPKDLNDLLDKNILEYNEQQKLKYEKLDEVMNQCLDNNNDYSAKSDLETYKDNVVINTNNLTDPMSNLENNSDIADDEELNDITNEKLNINMSDIIIEDSYEDDDL